MSHLICASNSTSTKRTPYAKELTRVMQGFINSLIRTITNDTRQGSSLTKPSQRGVTATVQSMCTAKIAGIVQRLRGNQYVSLFAQYPC